MARKRIWTLERDNFSLTGTTRATASLSVNLLTRLDMAITGLKGWTISRIIGQAMVLNASAETSAAVGSFVFGIGPYNRNMDAVDFPELNNHSGDWPFFHGAAFKGAGTGLTPVEPENARNFSVNVKSQRKLSADQDLFAVALLTDISVDLEIEMVLSLLWLAP